MAHVVDIDTLSAEQRLDLIGELWNGLSQNSTKIPVPREVIAEIDRRRSAYEADPSSADLWADVKARILCVN